MLPGGCLIRTTQMTPSPVLGLCLPALHQDFQEHRSDHTNLRISPESFCFDQQWVNDTVAAVVERTNQLHTEFRVVKEELSRQRDHFQVSLDALHLRVRLLEQLFPELRRLD